MDPAACTFGCLSRKKKVRLRSSVERVNSFIANLASDLNFARFYLSDLLVADIEKIIYLDADTIVLGDVTKLYDEALTDSNDFPFAAVSRKEKKICGSFLNCAVPEVMRLMHEHGIFNPEKELDAFNAGVMVMHLKRWNMLK